MKSSLKTMLVASSLMFGNMVFAQDAAPSEGVQTSTEGNVTNYNFEDDLVTGDLVRPDGELLNVRRRGKRASLIEIRQHFIPEMLKSVENL